MPDSTTTTTANSGGSMLDALLWAANLSVNPFSTLAATPVPSLESTVAPISQGIGQALGAMGAGTAQGVANAGTQIGAGLKWAIILGAGVLLFAEFGPVVVERGAEGVGRATAGYARGRLKR